jgi:hypothetical protein
MLPGYYQPVALVDFLRLMPKKIPDYRAARTSGTNEVCRVKNRLKADFFGVLCAKRNKLLGYKSSQTVKKSIPINSSVLRSNPLCSYAVLIIVSVTGINGRTCLPDPQAGKNNMPPVIFIRVEGLIPPPLCGGHKGIKPEYKYLVRTTYPAALRRGC